MRKLVTPRAPLKMRLQNRPGAVLVANKVGPSLKAALNLDFLSGSLDSRITFAVIQDPTPDHIAEIMARIT